MRRAEIRCSQSNTSFYQSVFAEHVTKIRVGFFRSKQTGSDSIIDDYVLQMWETFQLSRGTHKVEHKHVDEIIEEDKNIRGGYRHCKNCEKKIRFGFYWWKHVKCSHGSQEWKKNLSHDSDDVGTLAHKVKLVKNVKKPVFWFFRCKLT